MLTQEYYATFFKTLIPNPDGSPDLAGEMSHPEVLEPSSSPAATLELGATDLELFLQKGRKQAWGCWHFTQRYSLIIKLLSFSSG